MADIIPAAWILDPDAPAIPQYSISTSSLVIFGSRGICANSNPPDFSYWQIFPSGHYIACMYNGQIYYFPVAAADSSAATINYQVNIGAHATSTKIGGNIYTLGFARLAVEFNYSWSTFSAGSIGTIITINSKIGLAGKLGCSKNLDLQVTYTISGNTTKTVQVQIPQNNIGYDDTSVTGALVTGTPDTLTKIEIKYKFSDSSNWLSLGNIVDPPKAEVHNYMNHLYLPRSWYRI